MGVAIAAPPTDGEANTELIRYLAEVLDLKKSQVSLEKVSGAQQLHQICRKHLVCLASRPDELMSSLWSPSGLQVQGQTHQSGLLSERGGGAEEASAGCRLTGRRRRRRMKEAAVHSCPS